MTLPFLKLRVLPPPVDLASASTVNDLATQIAFDSRSLQRFFSELRFLRQRKARTLMRIMVISEMEIATPLLAAVERLGCGVGVLMNMGAIGMLGEGEGDGDGSGADGVWNCRVVIGVEKMVAALTVSTEVSIVRDVKGAREESGEGAGIGIAAVNDEEGCDEDTMPDMASVEIDDPIISVVMVVKGLKLTSNVADERPLSCKDGRDTSEPRTLGVAAGWEGVVLSAAGESVCIIDSEPRGLLKAKMPVDCFVPGAPTVKRMVENAVTVSNTKVGVSLLNRSKTPEVAKDGRVLAPTHSGCSTISFGPLSETAEQCLHHMKVHLGRLAWMAVG
jgi:hypothetical protein